MSLDPTILNARCYRSGGKLVIEIPEGSAIESVEEGSPASVHGASHVVTDREKFLDGLMATLFECGIDTSGGQGEMFRSPMGLALQGAVRLLLEREGDQGVRHTSAAGRGAMTDQTRPLWES